MFSSKAGWHLPFALLTTFLFLYVFIGFWSTQWLTVSRRPPHALDSILSPETIDAIYDDARLHDAILELTETVAKASLNYGKSLENLGLEDFGNTLMSEVSKARSNQGPSRQKRQLFGGKDGGGIGGFFSGLFGGDKNSTTSLGDFFSQKLSNITGDIVGSLATPAYFLGIGIGMGAENGLNLTTANESQAIATKLAATTGEKSTGFNLVAQNLGTGLSGQLAPALANLGTGDVQFGMVAFALAEGVGQASASGLNLTQQQFPPSNGSDIASIAKNIGLGATGPIASNIDVKSLLSQAGGSSDFMAQIPQIAAAAGVGLGEGASRGLGLANNGAPKPVTKRQATDGSSQMDIPGIVGNLTMGLSQSFLESSNLSSLVPSGGAGLSLNASTLVSLASGAGKGIGAGVAVGLGGNASDSSTNSTAGSDSQTEELVAEQFTKNLVTSLLQNGGMKAIGNSLTSQAGGLSANVDVAKAAEGAARGLVEGSVSALSEAGGFQKVINGDFPRDLAASLPSLPPTQFNDSLNGSVVAFMRGLSGEGVLLISQLLNTEKNNSNTPPAKREIGASGVAQERSLVRRADTVIPAISDESLQDVAQTGLNAITCSGFGGLAALALGVLQGPALKNANVTNIGTAVPLDNSTLAALPKGPFTIMNEGNKLAVNIAQQSVAINGIELKPFAIITALHVVFSTLAFFFALPAYLALGAIWRFSDMIGQPINEVKLKKWRMIILMGLFTPFAIVGIILGIVGKGSAAHFRTAHSIFGLLALLFIIPSVVLSFMRLRTTVPIPPPSAFLFKNQLAAMKGPHKIHVIANMLVQQTLFFGMISWSEGFRDLRSISVCVIDAVLTAPLLVGLLNVVLFMQIGATGLLFARFLLERRLAQSGLGAVTYNEKGGTRSRKRTDTIKTFGFDSTPMPIERPNLVERRTADLLGREDSQIGLPMNARKFGETDPHPGNRVPSMPSNPFNDPAEQIVSPRVYNAKLGGFEDDRGPAFLMPGPNNTTSDAYGYNYANSYTANNDFRPSSELDPDSRYASYAAPAAPATARLNDMDLSGTPGPTLKRFESFSRPIKTPQAPTEQGWNR